MSLNFASYLASGYTPDLILQFVDKVFPNIGKAARNAKKFGKSAEEIVRTLSQLSAKQLAKADKRGDILNFDNPLERANAAARDDSRNPLLQGAKTLGTGLMAAGATAAALKGIPLLVEGLAPKQQSPEVNPSTPYQSTIQPSLQEGGIPAMDQGPTVLPQDLSKIAQGNIPKEIQQSQAIPQQPNPQISAPSAQQPPSIDSAAIIREMGLEPKINNLLAQGKSPEQISQEVVGGFNPKQRKIFTEKVQKGAIPPTFDALIRDYAAKATNRATIAPQSEESRQKPVKGDLIALPNGEIGELEHIKEKQALVKSDGRLHKVNADEMIASPLPARDLADLYEELIGGIEKETGEEVSRNVNWAGYDPGTNTLAYLTHLGALYVYDDISPEESNQLTSLLNKRKTTGENFIGAWKQGTQSPIGAAMAALIKKLQAERGGKGSEYSGKFLTIYDALEPAKKAANKKHEEMKKKRKK